MMIGLIETWCWRKW